MESLNGGLLALALPHGAFHTSFNHIDDVIEAAKVDDNDIASSYPSYSKPHAIITGLGCSEMIQISAIIGWIGLFTSMLIQMFFATLVRQYAKSLWKTQADYARLEDMALEEGYPDGEVEQSRQLGGFLFRRIH